MDGVTTTERDAGGERTSVANKPDTKPTPVVTATVLGRRRLSPSFARLTLGGEGLEGFDHQGYDQWFRLFIPREGKGRMLLPAGGLSDDWYAQYRAAPEDRRTWMRYATVADYRQGARPGARLGARLGGRLGGRPGAGAELDVDVVVHGRPGDPGSGPLSTWAQTAAVGDRVALLDQGTIFRPEQADQDVLLIGDETAVPAIAGILRRLAPGVRGRAFLEVPYPEDVRESTGPSRVEVVWLPRHGVADVPGQRLLDAVRGYLQADAAPYVYAAGEMRLTKALNHQIGRAHV